MTVAGYVVVSSTGTELLQHRTWRRRIVQSREALRLRDLLRATAARSS